MIIRISGEGQYDVPDSALGGLNELDATVERSLADEDEPTFRTALAALLDMVRAAGSAVDEDTLEPSDLVLPHAESTIDEVQALLGEEGLVPG